MELCTNIKLKSLKFEEQIPFLKWAGGKRWLAKIHSQKPIIPDSFSRYIEPFAGSAAMFFAVKPSRGILNDVNRDLVQTYQALKEDWFLVFKWLEEHHSYHDENYYYEVRNSEPKDKFEAAARFIYLNRTCFNALYRVNKQGKFNVPIGTKSKVILETDNFYAISRLLKGIQLTNNDFEIVIDRAGRGDFLFVDPPYTIESNSSPYVKYNSDFFSWEDQMRVKLALVRASKRGAQFLLTNIHDESIRKLYWGTGFRKKALDRKLLLTSKSGKKQNYTEYLISNF